MDLLGLQGRIIACDQAKHLGLQGRVIYENPDKTFLFATGNRTVRVRKAVFTVGDRIYSTGKRIIPKNNTFTRAYYSRL